jgi:hypothetical protein
LLLLLLLKGAKSFVLYRPSKPAARTKINESSSALNHKLGPEVPVRTHTRFMSVIASIPLGCAAPASISTNVADSEA